MPVTKSQESDPAFVPHLTRDHQGGAKKYTQVNAHQNIVELSLGRAHAGILPLGPKTPKPMAVPFSVNAASPQAPLEGEQAPSQEKQRQIVIRVPSVLSPGF